MDGDIASQQSVETSAVRLTGTNVSDDFHSIASQGLCIRIDNGRRPAEIDRALDNRQDFSGAVQVLSDGGLSP